MKANSSIKALTGLPFFLLFAMCLSCSDSRTPEQLTDALLKAASICDISEVEKLIKKGADVNGTGHPSGDRPLRIAAVNGHLQCVKKLLEAGADPTLTVRSGSMIFRPLVSVQAAAHLLREAKKTPPALLPMMNPALQEALDRGISEKTYEEIMNLLAEAEKQRSGKQ